MSKNAVNNIKMTGKQYVKKKEKTYCLVRKKKADNKKIRGVASVNKIATEDQSALLLPLENQFS